MQSGSKTVTIIPTMTMKDIRPMITAHNNQVCSTWGNYHFKNFDGDVYQLPGTCNYVFASHCKGAYEEFNIQIRRSEVNNVATISHIVMKLDGAVIELKANTATFNGNPVMPPHSYSGVKIEKSAMYIKVSSKSGLVIMWNQEDALLLELDNKFANQTCGLCGDFNGIPTFNEFISNDVKLTPAQFGSFQKMDGPMEQCVDEAPVSTDNCTDVGQKCETTLTSPDFSGCNSLVDPTTYIKACIQDMCLCKDPTSCMCNTMAEYSRQCAHASGSPPNWRTSNFCAKQCPMNMQYQECGSSCADTCLNHERQDVCESHCIDGCFCPQGTVYDDIGDAGCIPLEECFCTYNGESFAPGAGYSTSCRSCVCTGGLWNCQDFPCSATCAIEGGSHITTYDDTHYTIHGQCSYVISKHCHGDTFSVIGELYPCGVTDTETCLKSVALILNKGQTTLLIQSSGSVFMNMVYIQLPISTADFTIFRPSNFFIIVQTNIGLQLQIQLIPIMQVYLNLDSSYREKTCGLCGNFNDIPKDDFTAYNGVIEGTGASFANGWRTQSNCRNIENSFENPCSLSIENEKYAQHWCNLLTSTTGPFADCHGLVNPRSYYDNCLFDTCNCEKSEDCMCAALSSYVHACAAEKVVLSGWRTSVCSKYAMTCSESLTYSYSITSCQRTCRSLSEHDVTCDIKFLPVDGCVCPEGTYMNEDGKCVDAASCPCYHKGTVVSSGETVHENGAMCTCTRGNLQCIGDVAKKPECLAPMFYFDCSNATAGTKGSECQRTCQSFATECYSTQCVSGCVCPEGLVSDSKGGCIPEEQCPCIHNEIKYQPGENIKVNCNTCTCKNRMWQCTNNPCLGTCAVYGDGHYITFDAKRYSFSGDCEYTLVQDHCNNPSEGTFRVITENIPCGTTGTTCSKAIKLFLGTYELILSDENFEVVERGTGVEVPYTVRYMGIYLLIEAKNGLILTWDKKTTVFIKLTANFKGKVCGLCGNYDENGNNDFTTRSQSVVGDVLEFGNSWKFSPTCPDAVEPKDPCSKNPYRKSWAQKQCSIITSQAFATCHTQVDPIKYYDACVTDACACDTGGDCECFCTAVASYAQACSEVGVCVAWRTPTICPLFCDFYNHGGECEWHYKPCGAPCMKTCRNPSGKCLYDVPGLEGCYPSCPADKPYFDEDDMDCVAQCGCYDAEGNHYKPGAKVYSPINCQSCECTMKGIDCKYDNQACHCEYDGKMYNYNDTIYHTTDGIGGCISAVCGANGTIIRSIEMCTTTSPITTTPFTFSTTPATTTVSTTVTTELCVHEVCTWSNWYDTSYPKSEPQGGDFETLENIKDKGHVVCSKPKDIECRAKDYPEYTIEDLGQNVICSKNLGLTCYNSEQFPPKCYNYEIRIECCHYEPCGTTTPLIISTTEPTSAAATTGSTLTLSTVTETTKPHITTSKPEITTGIASTSAPGTTEKQITTTQFVPSSQQSTVTVPETTQLPIITTLPPAVTTGEINTTPSGTTEKQITTSQPATSTIPQGTTAAPVTTSLPGKTTVTVPSSTVCQPKCRWTTWFDENFPSSEIESGDIETFDKIIASGKTICNRPEDIRDIECRADVYPDVSISEIGQIVKCDVRSGLVCENEDQEGEFKMCYNYQIRVKCCDDYSHCIKTTPSQPATTSAFITTTAPVTTGPHVTTTTSEIRTTEKISPSVPSTTEQPITSHPPTTISKITTSVPGTTQPHVTTPAPGVTTDKVSTSAPSTTEHPTSSPHPATTTSLATTSVPGTTQVHVTTPAPAITTGKVSTSVPSTTELPLTLSPPVTTISQVSTTVQPATSAIPATTGAHVTTSKVSTSPSGTTAEEITTAQPATTTQQITTIPQGTTAAPVTTSLPGKTTVTVPSSTVCQPKCRWTTWFDENFPSSEIESGDIETFDKIIASGKTICNRPEDIRDIECRADVYPDVSISEIGQIVKCDVTSGLVCENEDQEGEFKMCYNYQIRVKCCDDYSHCIKTTPSQPATTSAFITTTAPVTTGPHVTTTTSEIRTTEKISPSAPSTTEQPITSQPPTTISKITTSVPGTTQPHVTTPAPGVTTGKVSTSAPSTTEQPTSSPHPATTTSLATTSVPGTTQVHVTTPAPAVTTGKVSTSAPSSTEQPTSISLPSTTTSQATTSVPGSAPVHVSTPAPGVTTGKVSTSAPSTTEQPTSSSHPATTTSLATTSVPGTTQVHVTTPAPAITTGKVSTSVPSTTELPLTLSPPVTTISQVSTTVQPASSAIPATTGAHVTTGKVNTSPSGTTAEEITTAQPATTTQQITTIPQGTTAAPVTTSLPGKTTVTVPSSTVCQPKCRWTTWFDENFPSSEIESGDIETFDKIIASGKTICNRPEDIRDIECRADVYPDVSISEIGQIVKCDVTSGLVCENEDQEGEFKMCYNYQIRVKCCDDYSHCIKTTPSQPATTSAFITTTAPVTTGPHVTTTTSEIRTTEKISPSVPSTTEQPITSHPPTTISKITTSVPGTTQPHVTTPAPGVTTDKVSTSAPSTTEHPTSSPHPATTTSLATTSVPGTTQVHVTTPAPAITTGKVSTSVPSTTELPLTLSPPVTTISQVSTTVQPATSAIPATTGAHVTTSKVSTSPSGTTAEEITTAQPATTTQQITTIPQGTTAAPVTTSLPGKTTVTVPSSTVCQPKCRWTTWFDENFPSSEIESGDIETFDKIIASGKTICNRPEDIRDIECRADVYPDVSISEIGQIVKCDVTSGLVCENEDQEGEFKMCYNYQIRVKCCDDYSHCIKTTPSQPATTSAFITTTAPVTTGPHVTTTTSEIRTTEKISPSAPSTTEQPITSQPPTTISKITTSVPGTTQPHVTTPAPGVTTGKVSTSAPSTTEQPTSSPHPATTTSLATTSVPGTTQVHVTTPAPAVTTGKVSTSAPSSTEQPTSISLPSTTTSQATTSVPGSAPVHVSTPAPGVTTGKVSTSAPSTTEQPTSSSHPATTTSLATTSVPGTTQVHVTTPAPAITTGKVSTSVPSTTELPLTLSPPVTTISQVSTTVQPASSAIPATTGAHVTTGKVNTSPSGTTAEEITTAQPATTTQQITTIPQGTTAAPVTTSLPGKTTVTVPSSTVCQPNVVGQHGLMKIFPLLKLRVGTLKHLIKSLHQGRQSAIDQKIYGI
ncbi:mucin-5AC [Microcaecilia unicolor]|uniref:Mucin-5AC-like n=1 Tax=Microcaecilia unicolor TaxID=1415580 RepID=A0A6P7Y0I0_9AMPH|nr:mucin-5AC-like [Microcaecilia unicolor]